MGSLACLARVHALDLFVWLLHIRPLAHVFVLLGRREHGALQLVRGSLDRTCLLFVLFFSCGDAASFVGALLVWPTLFVFFAPVRL